MSACKCIMRVGFISVFMYLCTCMYVCVYVCVWGGGLNAFNGGHT